MNAKDFQIVKVIGRGAFGEVQLVSKSFCTFTFMDDKLCPRERIVPLVLY